MKIAWLVQSDNFKLLKKQENEIKEFADLFTYNWKIGNKDPYQNTSIAPDLSWSVGRSKLYEFAQNQSEYDYFVFIDDDVVMNDNQTFSNYGDTNIDLFTISSGCWQEWFIRKLGFRKDCNIFCTDLQFQMISNKLCKDVFPVAFDGGWGTLWYPMFVTAKRGNYTRNIREFSITNTNSNPTYNYGGVENQNSSDIWRRSEKFMPKRSKLLGRLLGFKRTIWYLNLYTSMVRK